MIRLDLKADTLMLTSSIIEEYAILKDKALARRKLGQCKRRLREQLNGVNTLYTERQIIQALQIVDAQEDLLKRRYTRLK